MAGPPLLRRFWSSASGYWRGTQATHAWTVTGILLGITLMQLLVQYGLNLWNRDFFDAIGRRDGAGLFEQTLVFLPLVAGAVALAVLAVWARMTLQREWRAWMSREALSRWMADECWLRLQFAHEEHDNPEYRIAEDVRIATDAPVDLAVGLLTSILTALTFIHVLWTVGGSMRIEAAGTSFVVPGYLVFGALIYSLAATGGIMLIGRDLTTVIEAKNRTEARFRAAAGHLREVGEGIALTPDIESERRAITGSLGQVVVAWRALCSQLMRTTVVSQANVLLAPVFGLALAVPQYLSGAMSLGAVTQVGAAFVLVTGAFNWIGDNFQRLSDWASSAHRVAHLLRSLDEMDSQVRRPA